MQSILTVAGLGALIVFSILFLIGCIRLSGQADDASDQFERALTEGNGLHPPLGRRCGPGCCRGHNAALSTETDGYDHAS